MLEQAQQVKCEVTRIIDIFIDALHLSKDTFIRELARNTTASDALEQIWCGPFSAVASYSSSSSMTGCIGDLYMFGASFSLPEMHLLILTY